MTNLDEIKNYYPINEDLGDINFENYINKVINEYICIENRKVVGDEYPFLIALWYDYLVNFKDETCLDYLPRSIKDAIIYSNRFQNNFINVLNKLLPMTSKVIGSGTAIRNTIFSRQKFKYKRGVDESSKFSYKQNLLNIDNKQNLLKKTLSIGGKSNNIKGLGKYVYDNSGTIDGDLILYDFEINSNNVLLRWYSDDTTKYDFYEIERLDAGSCDEIDFELVISNELVTGNTLDNLEESKWMTLISGLTLENNSYDDDTVVPNSSYLYRIKAYNVFDEVISETLYVDILSNFIKENFIDNNFDTLEDVIVYRWTITNIDGVPPNNLFQDTSGIAIKLDDNLYYPIIYNSTTNEGTIENTQLGYLESNLVANNACGDKICPSIFQYQLSIENTGATIYIK